MHVHGIVDLEDMLPVLVSEVLHLFLPLALCLVRSIHLLSVLHDVEERAPMQFLSREVLGVIHFFYFKIVDVWEDLANLWTWLIDDRINMLTKHD